jgi:hypothetical protein
MDHGDGADDGDGGQGALADSGAVPPAAGVPGHALPDLLHVKPLLEPVVAWCEADDSSAAASPLAVRGAEDLGDSGQ